MSSVTNGNGAAAQPGATCARKDGNDLASGSSALTGHLATMKKKLKKLQTAHPGCATGWASSRPTPLQCT